MSQATRHEVENAVREYYRIVKKIPTAEQFDAEVDERFARANKERQEKEAKKDAGFLAGYLNSRNRGNR